MATPTQVDENPPARASRYSRAEPSIGTSESPPLADIATPAQLAEKGRHDMGAPSSPPSSPLAGLATHAQMAEKSHQHRSPPPLPPRSAAAQPPPPPYTANDFERGRLISEQWRSHDPRSSSTHSLVPSESARRGRRTLLLVYIHGFMGNESSFQSFPAHVHNLLTITVAETHMVHTKIYPRYKSRKAIDFARDGFSSWLEPHEDDHTEVVLLGHSMGGILAAEVALQESRPGSTEKPFRHRILGTINFDTPFLGMHPGVVASGISSLFRPAPEPPGSKAPPSSTYGANSPQPESDPTASPSIAQSQTSSQLSLVQSITSPSGQPMPQNSFFNPPFPNDVRLQERQGWSSVMHFIYKHSDGLTNATKQYVMSHLEFGGCLADYPGLKSRYKKLRELEDVDDITREDPLGNQTRPTRVRFVNYYTASTGRPKSPKPPPEAATDDDGHPKDSQAELTNSSMVAAVCPSPTNIPTMHIGKEGDGAITPQPLEDISTRRSVRLQMEDLGESSGVQNDYQEPPEMRHIDSIPIEEDNAAESPTTVNVEVSDQSIPNIKSPSEPPLPPIPDVPKEPDSIDFSLYTDKDSRKIAEKEHKRAVKAYQQAVKDRENMIKDRRKLIEKREKKARQEQDRQLKAEEKQRLKEEKEEVKKGAVASHGESKASQESEASLSSDGKPKRDKKFCMLPPRDSRGGRDKCWVRVYMDGVDEVGAHCGLFFTGPHYESLVGEVGARIEKWLEEDATRRAILEAETS
ncbi:Uncharacterized protein BP5553_09519 [Venustampulla echinocandica]|uniref:DUF676 domain-containing protein n=1 Tax=Venustampulla echinocandica TaxID=2656787 RepID=A0A370TCZ7_9HELO|nr:Uncharacterized protein BP5553_09519 [Venustampulla echinocandica]RDL32117.1 Uncharacterized protein BP5553_09519 [Venustampulla echinocandica]